MRMGDPLQELDLELIRDKSPLSYVDRAFLLVWQLVRKSEDSSGIYRDRMGYPYTRSAVCHSQQGERAYLNLSLLDILKEDPRETGFYVSHLLPVVIPIKNSQWNKDYAIYCTGAVHTLLPITIRRVGDVIQEILKNHSDVNISITDMTWGPENRLCNVALNVVTPWSEEINHMVWKQQNWPCRVDFKVITPWSGEIGFRITLPFFFPRMKKEYPQDHIAHRKILNAVLDPIVSPILYNILSDNPETFRPVIDSYETKMHRIALGNGESRLREAIRALE